MPITPIFDKDFFTVAEVNAATTYYRSPSKAERLDVILAEDFGLRIYDETVINDSDFPDNYVSLTEEYDIPIIVGDDEELSANISSLNGRYYFVIYYSSDIDDNESIIFSLEFISNFPEENK